ANRQVAYLHLKQLLNMPLDDNVHLTTGIDGATGPSLPAMAQATSASTDTSAAMRAPVRELDEAVRGAEAQVKIARSERIPSFALVSQYQRLYFPAGALPSLGQGVNNWTVGVSTNFPILDGGRIKGDQLIAQAALQQARAQRDQTKQFAGLDSRVALNSLADAQATWNASRGTAEQAQRAYAIDQVRFREGISTQTDLSQSRLLLEQALANRAQAPTQSAAGAVQQQQQQQQLQGQATQTRLQTTNPPGSGQP